MVTAEALYQFYGTLSKKEQKRFCCMLEMENNLQDQTDTKTERIKNLEKQFLRFKKKPSTV